MSTVVGRILALVPGAGAGRRFALVALVDAVGTGFFVAGSAIFFVRVVGLSPPQVGAGLAIANLTSFATTVPLGALADRWGARNTLIGMYMWRAVWFAVLTFVSGPVAFTIVVTLVTVADRAASPVTRAVVSAAVGTADRTRTLAVMRSIRNVGFSIGAALTALLLALQTRSAFQAIILADAASFVVAASMLRRMPMSAAPAEASAPQEPSPSPGLRFILLTAADGVLCMHIVILSVGLPLWLTLHTTAPVALAPVLVLVNTALVVLVQMRLAPGREDAAAGAGALRRSALALSFCCVLMAAAWHAGPIPATVLLVAATVALTFGELWESIGSWTLSYWYAREHRQSRDLSAFSLGRTAQEIAGPLLITGLVLGNGRLGWLCLAVGFAALTLPLSVLVKALERARVAQADGMPTPDGIAMPAGTQRPGAIR